MIYAIGSTCAADEDMTRSPDESARSEYHACAAAAGPRRPER